jgi:hypothetical protein
LILLCLSKKKYYIFKDRRYQNYIMLLYYFFQIASQCRSTGFRLVSTNWKEINLKKEILGSTTVRGTGADHNVCPYPTSYQNSNQTKSVRGFGTGGFATYRLPVLIYRHKNGGKNVFLRTIKNENERETFCNFNDRPYGHI